ncbi:S41 family peptidase [Nonomuraea sp. NPDC048826]|uniref:S41 family peptidase n=1 Tax=Nonomuraea sp. NPDC048826 TaxID=3364347 RepID=UPI0037189642
MKTTTRVITALTLTFTAFACAPRAPQAVAATTACEPLTGPVEGGLTATTVTTIEQAYDCVFARYYGAPALDHRTVLASAFAAYTRYLQRHGLDRPDATMPALGGGREADRKAFAEVYARVAESLPERARQAAAEATMQGMTDSLHDNHAAWIRPRDEGEPGLAFGYGVDGMSGHRGGRPDPAVGPPLHITSVMPGSPAAERGIRPGDVLVSVNGAPPYVAGVLSPGVLKLLAENEPLRLTLRRPATGRTWKTTLKAGEFRAERPTPSSRRTGGAAYVKLPDFGPGTADEVIRAVGELRKKGKLSGVVLDLRGNRGGSPQEVTRLLGAFAHGKVTGHECDVHGSCTALRTDDSVPLLKLPLVVLVDRQCGSACDDFSAAVKGLKLAPLVGTRTAGALSGPASAFRLGDGSILLLPGKRHVGPDKEVVDDIGVAPDHHAPLTAEDLSKGRDPGLAKALALLS